MLSTMNPTPREVSPGNEQLLLDVHQTGPLAGTQEVAPGFQLHGVGLLPMAALPYPKTSAQVTQASP